MHQVGVRVEIKKDFENPTKRVASPKSPIFVCPKPENVFNPAPPHTHTHPFTANRGKMCPAHSQPADAAHILERLPTFLELCRPLQSKVLRKLPMETSLLAFPKFGGGGVVGGLERILIRLGTILLAAVTFHVLS